MTGLCRALPAEQVLPPGQESTILINRRNTYGAWLYTKGDIKIEDMDIFSIPSFGKICQFQARAICPEYQDLLKYNATLVALFVTGETRSAQFSGGVFTARDGAAPMIDSESPICGNCKAPG
jgi:hypothetical protein